MSEKYYFAGHETLTNRGCEALLRGISTIIREQRPNAEFLAPSFDRVNDAKQWSGAQAQGIRFIPAYRLPFTTRLWAKAHKSASAIRHVWIPSPAIPSPILESLRNTTAGIMTGGDVLSLDYGVPPLVKWMGQANSYINSGRPMFLWAASVGPFDKAPDLERHMARHLARYAGITVRESSTLNYLNSLGLNNVQQVADPAFVMVPEPWDISGVLPTEEGEGLLGFNISPLIKAFRNDDAHVLDMETAVIDFLRDVIERTELSLVLIPHVDTVDGTEWNSDFLYMQRLLTRAQLPKERVSLGPRTLNAAQVKYLISQCRYFIGARTHSTIAAWSTLVPTISIAYSIKALGLNTDLFGDLRFVLETPKVSRTTLWESLEKLRVEEQAIKELLAERIPVWRQRARTAATQLLAVVR